MLFQLMNSIRFRRKGLPTDGLLKLLAALLREREGSRRRVSKDHLDVSASESKYVGGHRHGGAFFRKQSEEG